MLAQFHMMKTKIDRIKVVVEVDMRVGNCLEVSMMRDFGPWLMIFVIDSKTNVI